MKSKILIVAILIMIVGTLALFVFRFAHSEWQAKLISPGFNSLGMVQKSSPSPVPSPIPKTFKFDESTNLEQETETVNPEVEDEDFSELKTIIGAI